MSVFVLDRDWIPSLRRLIIGAVLLLLFGFYLVFATTASLILPLALPIFLAPAGILIFIAAPQGKAVPRRFIWPVVLAGAALMPFWPVYIHIAIGPLPLLTPPRVLFYVLSAIWLYDMTVSPWRRGQFFVALRKRPWLASMVLGFFFLQLLSVPLAEGRGAAFQTTMRQAIIWLIPFCAMVTYVRRWRELRLLIMATALGGVGAGTIAILEAATHQPLVTLLEPLIMSDGIWLDIAREMKIRDGAFRAQATHTHPISLGEFLAFCAPLTAAFALSGKSGLRLLWVTATVLIIAGSLVTGSRGALLSLVVGGGVIALSFAYTIMRDPRRRKFRPVVGLAMVFAIAATPVVGFAGYRVVTGETGTSAAKSSQSRLDQIEKAWPKLKERPVLGYGAGRSAKIVGYYGRALSLDNYYLSLAVELGFPGAAAFLLMLIVAANISLYWAKRGPPAIRWPLIGLCAGLAAFIVSRMILSQTGNLNWMFPLLGALLGASANAKKSRRHKD